MKEHPQNSEKGQVKIVFLDESDKFKINELVDYLTYLKAIYVHFLKRPHILNEYKKLIYQTNTATSSEIAPLIENIFIGTYTSERSIKANYKKKLGNEDIFISNITKQSPLEIILYGVLLPLSWAVVMSGGTIKLGAFGIKLECNANALGDGIRKIKKVFQIAGEKNKRRYLSKKIETVELPQDMNSINDLTILEDASNIAGIDVDTKSALQNEIERRRKELNDGP